MSNKVKKKLPKRERIAKKIAKVSSRLPIPKSKQTSFCRYRGMQLTTSKVASINGRYVRD